MAGQNTNTTPDERAGLLVELLRQVQLVWKLMGDPRVSTMTKVLLPALAAGYLLFPVDLLPDFILGLGQMDDLAVLALAIKLFVSLAPPQVVAEHRESIRHGGRQSYTGAPADESETVEGDYRVVD